jgi:starch phosphorylase
MDSLARSSTALIRHSPWFGIFDQAIHDGWQVETRDKMVRKGNPWEIARQKSHKVGLAGTDVDG